jgi:hypothetical protein
MLLTHLCVFQFLGGASPVPVVSTQGFGGSNALPPYFLFDGLSPVTTPFVVIDGHDGVDPQKKRSEDFVKDKRDLREKLDRAIRLSKGIADDIPQEIAAVKSDIRAAYTRQDIDEVTEEVRRVIALMQEEDDDEVFLLLN